MIKWRNIEGLGEALADAGMDCYRIDNDWVAEPDAEAVQAFIDAYDPHPIEKVREGMVVSAMQGILALGETNWGKVLTYRSTASWSEQMIIDSAQDWRRTSQNIQFIGYLIDFNDDQMDTMFTAAALVEA